MLCFTYGSNMSSRRLQARVQAAFVAVAERRAHRLAFHKLSRSDGSGKCDAWFSGDPQACPFTWYRDHVLIGAREYGLPRAYCRWIESVPAWTDPNPQREAKERAVHSC